MQPHAPLSRRAVQCPSANVGDHSSVLKLSHPSWCGMPETRNQVHARHPMHPLLQQPAINHEEKDPLASTTHQSGKPQWDHISSVAPLLGRSDPEWEAEPAQTHATEQRRVKTEQVRLAARKTLHGGAWRCMPMPQRLIGWTYTTPLRPSKVPLPRMTVFQLPSCKAGGHHCSRKLRTQLADGNHCWPSSTSTKASRNFQGCSEARQGSCDAPAMGPLRTV